MRKIKTKWIKIAPVFGFGYWKDVYTSELHGLSGEAHNFIVPFIRIQLGYLLLPPTK